MQIQQIRQFGTPDVFETADVALPEPGPGQIRVRQIASSVNPVDTKLRAAGPAIAPALPAVLGCDVAGEVDAVGDNVRRFAVGDAVYGCAAGLVGRGGAYGEYVVVDAELMAFKPAGLGWRETAALPLVTITAWEALIDRTRVAPGDHVLIHGGAGGVGHIAIQIAKAQGARVATTVSSADKAAIARRCGADETIHYREESVAEYVERLTGGRGFDVVFDATGGSDIGKSFAAVRVNGQVATIVSQYSADLTPMHTKSLTLHTIFMLTAMLNGVNPAHHGEILTRAGALVAAGQLVPLLDERRFNLGDVGAAHAHLEAGAAIGKVVIDIADEARAAGPAV
ncbi:zinc-dependent alcohol dehydrogenase family protein [Salinisphaera sp. LB1]|uniref:zinc-dependent alcohol dehydrogenase family protein n=1 Tax=Salinisphaera sp. LB1 TaxID=2183911 RepID=UPI000D7050E0|nr:zinc-dependent alcohol dehydrogenase family protein [Salinisphaera sp. LB1]AWN14530.1 Bifunctional protein: zinc-containing alcohol dehydrogenase [Salinisphaera sp. LB1]